MSKKIEDYLEIIPEEYRYKLTILEPFKGNRTICKFSFACGCETSQSLKAILKLKDFQYCFYCKSKYCEKYTCKFCQTEFIQLKMYEQCLSQCAEKYNNLIEGIDFVICQICGFHAKSLGGHLNKNHNLTPEEYIKIYAKKVICDNSYEKYKIVGENNIQVLIDYHSNNDNKKDFCKKVSDGIINNPELKNLHSNMMTELNKRQQSDPEFQKLVSETAKITSARPEIQEQRAAKLKKWRDENPEDFHNQCITKMIGSFQSKPEKKLFEFVSMLDGFYFKKNQFINSLLICNKSHNKQMDMGDKEKRIYIEFDGILHFEPRRGTEILEKIQQKDKEIEQHITNHNWTLIRVSYDQFKYSTKMVNKVKQDNSYFKQECLDKIVEILNSNQSGIYKIGEVYGQH